VTAALVTAKLGGDWMGRHLGCGETLLAFRWAWGLVGGHWSRFATFLPTPRRRRRGLRGRAVAADAAGPGPLGSLSVWAFLVLLTLQVATGLVADDDVATTGPLNAHVGHRLAQRASGWHAGPGANLIWALIALHVAAIGWYTLRRREPLLRAMWSGDKWLAPGTRACRDGVASRLLALALGVPAGLAVWLMVRLAG
jgi:cytochrome b